MNDPENDWKRGGENFKKTMRGRKEFALSLINDYRSILDFDPINLKETPKDSVIPYNSEWIYYDY